MNILIDFLTVSTYTGAGEYHRKVFYTLLDYIRDKQISDIKLFALYDSSTPVVYNDLLPKQLGDVVEYVNINGLDIREIINKKHIDLFFIVCAQNLNRIPGLLHIECKVVCVIHDLAFEEIENNGISTFCFSIRPKSKEMASLTWKWKLLSWFTGYKSDNFELWYRTNKSLDKVSNLSNIVKAISTNMNYDVIVVSEYTKFSLVYNYSIPQERITVLYSPERFVEDKAIIENKLLQDIIQENKKYYLMLSANKEHKNPYKTVNAFKRYVQDNSDIYLVTVGYRQESHFANHIVLPFLSDSDLHNAIKYCYALLYPSFFEGFGYPPVEAMHYGKPVLCSYTTSMPRIYGDAPIYFSPIYESGIYEALSTLDDKNYEIYALKSRQQYEVISKRQQNDLKILIKKVLNEH